MEELEQAKMEFLRYTETMVRETCAPFFKGKTIQPYKERAFFVANEFYATVLFHVGLCVPIGKKEIEDAELEEQEKSGAITQAAFLFQNWEKKGTRKACEEYCDFLNGAVEEVAFSALEEEYLLLPNFRGKAPFLYEKLLSLKQGLQQKMHRIL